VVSFDVRVEGLEPLLRDLRQPLEPVLSSITFAVGELVRSEMAVTPGAANRPVIWASEKSRRYYFWLRRSRGLDLRYSRGSDSMSQQISKSWKIAHLGQTDALVDNKATYGPFVQSAEFQTAQHKATGWITDEKGVANVERSGDVERVAERIITKQTAFKD
jgi:hypothetical protein